MQLRGTNTDDARRAAKDVVVRELLGSGVVLETQSARLNGNRIEPTGDNPYWFSLGDLPHGTAALLEYTVLKLDAPKTSETGGPNGSKHPSGTKADA